jgi:hypothetical protein
VKKTVLFLIACVIMLARCDNWNQPIIAPLLDSIDEYSSIKEIKITRPPYPNTFTQDELLAVLSTGGWEQKYGLKVSGIYGSKEIRILDPSEYHVSADGPNPDGGVRAVAVTLNDTHRYASVTASFAVAVLPSGNGSREVIVNSGITGGHLIPFPSRAAIHQEVIISLYPDEGYAYKEDSLTASCSGLPVPITKTDDGAFAFIMPDGTVAVGAEFVRTVATVKIGDRPASYHETLEEAFAGIADNAVADDETATITLSQDTVIEQGITVAGSVTLTAADGREKVIRRGGSFTGSLFTVGTGAILTLDAGNAVGIALDGGKDAGRSAVAPLVTVSGGDLATGERVTLRNNANTAGAGGGVLVSSGSFTMSGGEISGNSAIQGGGVEVGPGGMFVMSGNSVVKQEVYLETEARIAISGPLTPPQNAYSAEIRVTKPERGAVILEGTEGYTLSAEDIAKFQLKNPNASITLSEKQGIFTPSLVTSPTLPASPVLPPSPTTPVETPYEAFYYDENGSLICTTLQSAVTNAPAGSAASPAAIYIAQNITVASKVIIQSGTHRTLTVQDGASKTIRRNTSDSLFEVKSDATLTLVAGGGGGGSRSLALDGNKDAFNNTSSLIQVSGTLKMGDGITLQNNCTQNGGGGVLVNESSTFIMTGGEISGNTALSASMGSGGVFVYNGTFTMTGGTVSGNTAANGGGGGVAVATGTFTMTGGKISGNMATGNGGGVAVTGGTFIMTDGEISENKANGNGGGVLAINGGTVTMTDSEINGNAASTDGGGVYVDGGTFTMTDSNISKNTAANGGGGVYAKDCTSTVTGCEMSENTAVNGGGIYVNNGTVTMTDGKISDNTNSSMGGGVYISGTSGAFIMKSGRISGNTASYGGGGVLVYNGTFTMADGEISDNTDSNMGGGGVYIVGGNSAFTMNNGKISRNKVQKGCGGGGVLVNSGGTFTMTGGEISHNDSHENNGGGGVTVHGGGIFTMTGGDIVDNTALNMGGGVLVKNNGKFTMNSGTISVNQSSAGGGGVSADSGSTFTMTGGTISGNKTTGTQPGTWFPLRYAGGGVLLQQGSAFVMSGGIIRANQGIDGYGGGVCAGYSFTMTGGEISGNTTISSTEAAEVYNGGGGVYIDGLNGGNFTLDSSAGRSVISQNKSKNGGGVYVGDGEFTMNGSKISDNTAEESGGGVYIEDIYGATFTLNGGMINGNTALMKGGGVFRGGSFTINGGMIGDNEAHDGGGLYISGPSTTTMKGGEISGNEVAGNGGGVCIEAGSFTMKGNATISGNKAANGGGVVVKSGQFFMSGNTTASGNEAAGNGGGVCTEGGTFMMKGYATVSGNKAVNGGGVSAEGGTGGLGMQENATISGNTAVGKGGGVYVDGSSFVVQGPDALIYGENADTSLQNTASVGKAVYRNSAQIDTTFPGIDESAYL